MSLPTAPEPSAPQPYEAPEHCSYCGAKLDAFYYFCPVCATPYKPVEAVLPSLRIAPPTDGERVAKSAPHVKTVFWTYFSVIVVTSIAGFAAFRGEHPELVLFFQMGVLFVTTCIFAARFWQSLAVQFKRIGLFTPQALLGLLALVPLLTINYLYHGWIRQQAGPGAGSDPLTELRQAGLGEPAIILFFCVFPAVLEETAFRGLVQHWLQVALRPWRAIVLASALFVALHFSVISAPYLFAVAIVLGWTKWKTGSLYPSMLIHFLHNLFAIEFLWR